jgi:predicted Fe-Mo cluster-binding NifX family protein
MKKPMKVAIPEWQGRVSPVFDVARHLRVFESENGQARVSGEFDCETVDPSLRVAQLAATGATVLICGAISRPLEMAVTAAGIQVIAQTCGNVQDVADAYARGQLISAAYCMPGCGRQQRRCQRRGGQNRAW